MELGFIFRKKEFSRKNAIEATGFPPRTAEAIIEKLFDLKKLDRIGEGRGIRYRVLKKLNLLTNVRNYIFIRNICLRCCNKSAGSILSR